MRVEGFFMIRSKMKCGEINLSIESFHGGWYIKGVGSQKNKYVLEHYNNTYTND